MHVTGCRIKYIENAHIENVAAVIDFSDNDSIDSSSCVPTIRQSGKGIPDKKENGGKSNDSGDVLEHDALLDKLV